LTGIVVGLGEIGQAVREVFSKTHDIDTYDIAIDARLPDKTYDIMLVCFPYSDIFVSEVIHYSNRFNVKASIIFSTTSIGTTSQISNAVHSPVEGKHPRLAKSIRLMPRWVGGYNELAHQFLVEAGFNPYYCEKPEHTEFLKLRSTAKYGVNIEWTRYEKTVADDLGMDFEQVKRFDRDYNLLYKQLFMPQFQRYILDPPKGMIGGHCVVPNSKILDAQYPSVFLKEIYREKGDNE